LPKGSAGLDAEGLETVLAGVSIDASAFVEKVSGSRPGCPSAEELEMAPYLIAFNDEWVPEICHLLADPQRRGRTELAAEFCAAVEADEVPVIEATPHDCRRMAELLTTYASLHLRVVDACIVTLAERLDLREIAALDRRDLLAVAPRHLPQGRAPTLVPAE
jgi:predicted nucleic acid-binding protein